MSGLLDPSESIFSRFHPDPDRNISYSGLLATTEIVTVFCLGYSMFCLLGAVAYSCWVSKPCCSFCDFLLMLGCSPYPSELPLAKIDPKRRLNG